MKKTTWRETAELIGIIAIVASLIFVGLQLRQSQEIAIADQYQSRADTAVQWYSARAQSPQLFEATVKRISETAAAGGYDQIILNALEEQGAEAVATAYLEYRSNMTMLDNYHFQYENGFLTEDAWRAYRERLKAILAVELNAALYLDQENRWRISFQELCAKLIAENKTEL
jgi:hypothetical protein